MKYRFLRFPEGKNKAMTFTYDDGIKLDETLTEIFNRYNFKCTFNIPGTTFQTDKESPKWNTEFADSQIYQKGHEVAVHGAQHKSLMVAEPKDWVRDLLDNRSFLEKYYNRIIRGMAYPDCSEKNDETVAILKALGFTFARLGSITGNFSLPKDWLKWECTSRNKDPKLLDLAKKFVEFQPNEQYISHRDPLFFSVWGHSFEFPPDDWKIMEELGEICGNREDVWYANNSQVYDYVQAYNRLVFSCDNTLVYNPSVMTVWFVADGVDYVVQPGETISLQ